MTQLYVTVSKNQSEPGLGLYSPAKLLFDNFEHPILDRNSASSITTGLNGDPVITALNTTLFVKSEFTGEFEPVPQSVYNPLNQMLAVLPG